MGWTETIARHYKNGKVDRKAEIADIFNDKYEIIKSTLVGSVWYGAVKHDNEVFGCVILTSVRNEDWAKWFGYKDMDETMGPYYFDCPDSILNLLTPTDNEQANIWRDKCRKYTKKKKEFKNLPVGTHIKFKRGDEEKHLQLMSPYAQFRTNWWKVLGEYNTYFKKSDIPMDYEIVA